MPLTISFATKADAKSLVSVYKTHVTKFTAMHSRTPVPSVQQMEMMIQEISQEYPFLVCRYGDRILGYCYAHSGVEAASIDRDVEFFVTTDKALAACGIGTALCSALFELLRLQNVQRVFGKIQAPNPKAEQLLMHFHFVLSSHFYSEACMCGQNHEILWFDKWIHTYSKHPPATHSVGELSPETCRRIMEDGCKYIDMEELEFCL